MRTTFIRKLLPTGALVGAFVTLAFLNSCSYDNAEELFGQQEPTECDTAAVTYSGTIKPLLTQHCYSQNGVSCHSGNTPEAGINLTDYNTVKLYAGFPTLLAVVEHRPGYPAMPQNGTKLSDCDIAHLRTWIDAGALNN
ncbi:cytochrome c [Hymenobacter busanensis]|uniref:Cytochrome c n=1 Tax=Hymenobacter busanensis TaxID=2607656 RepID=A0A7L5A1R9_9BACT|nr:cytochrome c [Hymenobacter busanensis]KAA9338536.1 cytochrome c [Hymenobacter busanensis]QHJ09036.1 hypothetical protein GUY19_17800 [Hymenobacter busanensis]